jgi:hypothetical protein
MQVSSAVSKHLAKIGRKGGRNVTPLKRAVLQKTVVKARAALSRKRSLAAIGGPID